VDYFGHDRDIASIESRLASGQRPDRPALLVTLAWFLRQRDTVRALGLCDEAEGLLNRAETLSPAQRSMAGRIALVRYKGGWLLGTPAGHAELLQQARAHFTAAKDPLGLADCAFIESMVLHEDEGDSPRHEQAVAASIEHARVAGDPQRLRLGQIRQHTALLVGSPQRAQPPPVEVAEALQSKDPGLRCFAACYAVHHHYLHDELGRAIALGSESFAHAMAAGQLRLAINIASAVAADYHGLGDAAGGLEWMERALVLARRTGWPRTLGWTLSLMAWILRDLGRHDTERELLAEALQVLQPYAGSRSYFAACASMGNALLALGQPEGALQRLCEAESLARTKGFPDIVGECVQGQARALSMLGQVNEAIKTAVRAAEEARLEGRALAQISPLQTLADISRSHGLPAPAGSSAPSAAIHHLERVVELSGQMGAAVPPAVFAALSRDCEAAGAMAESLRYARAEAQALASAQAQRADHLAAAVQARCAVDKAAAEAARQRALAETQSRQAQALAAAHDTLRGLAAIGQEITSNLNMNVVFEAIRRHVGQMLDAPSIAVFLQEERWLVLRFGVENERTLPLFSVPLDHPLSQAVRCVRERRLLRLDLPEQDADQLSVIPGTACVQSALFAPLMTGGQVVGVLSIQSPREHAYGERECQIVRLLAAYAAVAFANARRAQQLADAQADLERERMRNLIVHAGKLATVGRLASGLVHELSHPVGVIALSVGSMQPLLASGQSDAAQEFAGSMRHEAARLHALVQRLRNMARLEAPRLGPVDLAQAVREAHKMFEPQLVADAIAYAEHLSPTKVCADGELLSLVVAILVANARQAMAYTAVRRIDVNAWQDSDWGCLAITDSGPGLPDHVRQQLANPTLGGRPAYQDMGLELALCAEYVAAMGGRIRSGNPPKGGAELLILLPVMHDVESPPHHGRTI
jgi:C4-dicarboxylate-specific signal transduction histidine kinase